MRSKRRDGALFTEIVRRACRDCNSGWMSDKETAVKPILLPLLWGQSRQLTTVEQRTLGDWCALVAVLACFLRPAIPIPSEYLTSYYELRHPPEMTTVLAAHFTKGTSMPQSYRRRAMAFLPSGSVFPEECRTFDVTINVWQFGFKVVGFPVPEHVHIPEQGYIGVGKSLPAIPVWPPQPTTIVWPPKPGVDDIGMAALARATLAINVGIRRR